MAVWCWAIVCTVVASLTTTNVWSQTVPSPSFSLIPSDTEAAAGHTVIFYCTVANLSRHQVFWNIDQRTSENTAGKEFTIGPNVNTHDSYPRFQFVGEPQRGEFNLQITDVKVEDAGSYICLVNDPNFAASKAMEAGAMLTVRDSPVAPEIGFPQCNISAPGGDSQVNYGEDEVLTLTCLSRGGVPLPQLTWVRVQENNITQNLPSKTTVSGGAITVISRVTLSSVDHQSFYRCIEIHPRNQAERNCREPSAMSGPQMPLNVLFKPVVSITPSVVNVQLLETVTVELRCEAYANPPLTNQPLIILPENKTGEDIPEDDLAKRTVKVEMTTDDVGKDFYCRSANEIGIGEASVDVRRLGTLPTWLILVIIGAAAIVLFIFIAVVACICCVDRSQQEEERYKDRLQYSINRSRPTSKHPDGEDDVIDGYEDDVIPIEDFQGGQESAGLQDDFETGEKGPRYQNVNEVFQGDSVHDNGSFSQSNPSSSEPILDPNSE